MRAALALLCAGCGLLEGEGGGAEHLPIAGAGPYGFLSDFEAVTPLDEPFVLFEPGVDLGQPAPVALANGQTRVFYDRAGAEIWRVDLPSLRELPGPPEVALVADADWEGGRVAAPALVVAGPRLIAYYEGAGGIGRASSVDGGVSWSKDGLVLPDAAQPGAALVAGETFLYFTRPAVPGIFLARSSDGLNFTVADRPVLLPRAAAFDSVRVDDPTVVGRTTGAGVDHFGLFYVGTNAKGIAAVGYAGSRDGVEFVALPAPILEPLGSSARAPGVLLATDHALLLVERERGGHRAIAAATEP